MSIVGMPFVISSLNTLPLAGACRQSPHDSFCKCRAPSEPRLSPLLAEVAETNLLVQRWLSKKEQGMLRPN